MGLQMRLRGMQIRPFLSAGFRIGYKVLQDTGNNLSKCHSGCGVGPRNKCGMRDAKNDLIFTQDTGGR